MWQLVLFAYELNKNYAQSLAFIVRLQLGNGLLYTVHAVLTFKDKMSNQSFITWRNEILLFLENDIAWN